MTQSQQTAANGQLAAGVEAVGSASAQIDRLGLRSPYLQGFGVDIGAFEYELPAHSITIGRAKEADLHLPLQLVSRTHATITPDEGRFILADAGSTSGVAVNGKKCDRRVLEHGDSIQIAGYILQFRMHDPLPGATEAAARAKALLRSEYCTLPSTMRLKFRTLDVGPRPPFATGDTLKIGHGGLLIPTDVELGDAGCLELHMAITPNATKRFLGEVMGIFNESGVQWVCAKLHTIPRDTYDRIVAGAVPGEWVEVRPT